MGQTVSQKKKNKETITKTKISKAKKCLELTTTLTVKKGTWIYIPSHIIDIGLQYLSIQNTCLSIHQINTSI